MTVAYTTDKQIIKSIFTALHDEIASDDYPHPDEVDFDYMISKDVFLAVEKDGVVGGVFYIHEKAPRVWHGHIQMLPLFRGEIADQAIEEAIVLLCATRKVKKVITHVPSVFKNVAAFLKRHQFKRIDVLEELYMKGGKEYPIYVYERGV
jgi:hypothetical protein